MLRDPEVARAVATVNEVGSLVCDAWTEGPPSPGVDALLQALRPELARVDAEVGRVSPVRGWLADRMRLSPVAAGGLATAAVALLVIAVAGIPAGPTAEPPGPIASDLSLVPSTLASAAMSGVEGPIQMADGEDVYELDLREGAMIFQGPDGSTIIWLLEDDTGERLSRPAGPVRPVFWIERAA